MQSKHLVYLSPLKQETDFGKNSKFTFILRISINDRVRPWQRHWIPNKYSDANKTLESQAAKLMQSLPRLQANLPPEEDPMCGNIVSRLLQEVSDLVQYLINQNCPIVFKPTFCEEPPTSIQNKTLIKIETKTKMPNGLGPACASSDSGPGMYEVSENHHCLQTSENNPSSYNGNVGPRSSAETSPNQWVGRHFSKNVSDVV